MADIRRTTAGFIVLCCLLSPAYAGVTDLTDITLLQESDQQSQVTASVENNTPIQNLSVELESEIKRDRSITLNYTGNNRFDGTLSGLPRAGFDVNVTTDSSNFRNLSRHVHVSAFNDSYTNSSERFTRSNSSVFCSFLVPDQETGERRDYTCEYEHFQGLMGLSQAESYSITKNRTYRNRSLRFLTEEFSNDTSLQAGRSRLTCAPSSGDYDCNTSLDQNPFSPLSGERQGIMIYTLWKAQQVVKSKNISDRAMNYTQGSAEDCDVWSSDYNCTVKDTDVTRDKNAESQASMILGYWQAYSSTGNTSYKDIALELSNTSLSHPRMAWSMWKGYGLTGNETLKSRAINQTSSWLDRCPANCRASQQVDLWLSVLEAHDTTGDNYYYRKAIEQAKEVDSPECSALSNSTSCSNPETQGLMTLAMWRTTLEVQDVEPRFYMPEIKRTQNSSLSVDAKARGLLSKPKVTVSNRSCSAISSGKPCIFPREVFKVQKGYGVQFQSESERLPKNGSIITHFSFENQTLLDLSKNYSTSRPASLCSPFRDDTTCNNVVDQAYMIDGVSAYAEESKNESALQVVRDLAFGNFTGKEVDQDQCSPAEDDFSCNSTQDTAGGVAQGMLAETYISLYERHDWEKGLKLGLRYARSNPEDCDPWSKEYDCRGPNSTGSLAVGMLSAYKQTGNETFLDKAEALANAQADTSTIMKEALLRLSHLTGNRSFKKRADMKATKTCEDCSGIGFERRQEVLRLGAVHRNLSLKNYTDFTARESRICSGFTCQRPRDQGALSLAYAEAHSVSPVDLELSAEASSSSSVQEGEEFQYTCRIENERPNTTIFNPEIRVFFSQGLSPRTANSSAPTLSFNETLNTSSQVTADSSGEKEIRCGLVSAPVNRNLTESLVSVSTPSTGQQEDSDEGGGGGGGGGGLSTDSGSQQEEVAQDDFEPFEIKPSVKGENLTTPPGYRSAPTCANLTRSVLRDYSVLRAEIGCEDIYVLEKLPDTYTPETTYETFNDSVLVSLKPEINYTGDAPTNAGDWGNTRVLKQVPVNMSVDVGELNLSSGLIWISAETARRVDCNVETVSQDLEIADTRGFNRTVQAKNNTVIEITCGGDRSSVRAVGFKQENGPGQVESTPPRGDDPGRRQVVFLALLGISGLLGSVVLYRRSQVIVNAIKNIAARIYIRLFLFHVDRDSSVKALSSYEKARRLSTAKAEETLSEVTDIDKSKYLFTSLDIIGRSGGPSTEVQEAVVQQCRDYVEKNDDHMAHLIRKRLDETWEKTSIQA